MQKITQELVVDWLPIRQKTAHKGEMGRILCVGGNSEMGGAIIMAGRATLYAGAGLVTVASAPENRSSLHAQNPEIMFSDMYNLTRLVELMANMNVIVLGPGLGRDRAAEEVVTTIMKHANQEQVIIVDADAINILADKRHLSETKAQVIYTPHAGEWQRLTGLVKEEAAMNANTKHRKELAAKVVLKGSPTEVYLETGVWQNTTGNPSQATGGMGDTLAGIVAGFIGQFDQVDQAILAAVFVHSYIADQLAQTHYVTLPTHIIEELPIVMRSLLKQKIR